MKVISCFAGLGGAELALKRVGIKADIYTYEIDKYAEAVNRYNNPDSIFLGDITKWKEHTDMIGEVDLIIEGSPCFTAGHLVMTINGAIPIENIKVGDYVLTHKGRYRKVLRTGGKLTNDLYRVSCQGEKEIITTSNHPFFIKRNDDEPKWINAKDMIIQSDYLGIIQSNNEEFLNDKYSEDFWHFVGKFVGDGWISKYKRKHRKNSYIYKVILCCGHKDFEETKQVLDKIGYNYYISKERTVYKFVIANKELLEYLEKCGKGAKNKRVHPDVWKLPLNKKKAFLSGYLSTDGWYNNKNRLYRASTTSRILSYELKQLTIDVYGTAAMIYKTNVAPKHIIEGRVVNQSDVYEISFKDEYKNNLKYKKTDNYCWLPLKECYKLYYTDIVYNLEVEEDNSYTINGIIVHNCQDLSCAGKCAGLQGARSGLFYTFLEMIKYYKPRFFVLENVASMSKANKDIITELMGVEPVMLNGALVSAQQRKRYFWTNIPTSKLEDKGIIVKDILESGDTRLNKTWCIPATYYSAGPINLLRKERTQVFEPIRIGNTGNSTGQGNRVYSIKGKTVNINANGGGSGAKTGLYKVDLPDGDYIIRKLTPIEVERAFTIPDNYTRYGKFADGSIKEISNTQRYKMLGNGFVVDVIVEGILKNIGQVKNRVTYHTIEDYIDG